jgi:hypothetical protein
MGNDRATNLETLLNHWGHSIQIQKPDDTFRFIFQNIQGLPINPQSHKHRPIGTALKDTEADVFRIAELNLNFGVLGPTYQWPERFQHLHRNHSIHSYNRRDSSTKRTLFGGTAQITIGPCSHRVIKSGADESGMGRWVWTLFTGRSNIKLRVISGY